LLDETHVTSRRGVTPSVATRKEDGDVSIHLGALVGGLAVWYWGEELREYAESRTVGVRRSAADMIRTVGKKAEDVLDRTKEQVSTASQAGQDAIRPPH